MPRKPKRDMDERTKLDMEFDSALEAILTDPELPEFDKPFLEVVKDEEREAG